MDRPLFGRSILVVEDEPLIAMDVVRALEAAGAAVSEARTLLDALHKAECPHLSAGVLDHGLKDGDSSQICDRLEERKIPFVVYSGYNYIDGPCSEGKQLRKPLRLDALVAAVVDLLRDRET